MIKPLPIDLPDLEQSVQWHSFRTRDPALTWLRAQLRQNVEVDLAAAAEGPAPEGS